MRLHNVVIIAYVNICGIIYGQTSIHDQLHDDVYAVHDAYTSIMCVYILHAVLHHCVNLIIWCARSV